MVVSLTGSRVRIVTAVPDRACFINADTSQFDTALINLAVNARDAMNGEGILTIKVEAVPMIPPRRRHPARSGDFIAVSVADTGTGLAPEDMDRIFEPFFTTKEVGKGTGLGLSQVIGFAKQSGGDVVVESVVGKGSKFAIYLPLSEAPNASGAVPPATEKLVDGHGICVLVVEDNADVGHFATQRLAELGYDPVLTTDAGAALAALAREADRFDVVFSDVVMPGMNGIELGQEIRRRHPDLPVVLTSGYSDVLAQNGTFGFELLHKPYSIEELSRILRKASTWKRRKRAFMRR
jgi:CheY-like chemotaxis protein